MSEKVCPVCGSNYARTNLRQDIYECGYWIDINVVNPIWGECQFAHEIAVRLIESMLADDLDNDTAWLAKEVDRIRCEVIGGKE